MEAELYSAKRKEKCLAKCDANHVKCKNYCSSCHARIAGMQDGAGTSAGNIRNVQLKASLS